MTRVLSEAGLFKHDQGRLDELLTKLDSARTALETGELTKSRTCLLQAATKLDAAVHSRSAFWRLVYVHRFGIFLYLVAIFLFMLNVGSGYFEWIADEVWGVPTPALGFGAAGAVLRSLYWLYRQVASRVFRYSFALAHTAAPFIGALLGLLTYLLLGAGLLVVEGGHVGDVERAAGPYGLCFVAGFSWEWILGWVQGFVTRGRKS